MKYLRFIHLCLLHTLWRELTMPEIIELDSLNSLPGIDAFDRLCDRMEFL